MEVDLEGLQKWREHIASLTVDRLDMKEFRHGLAISPKCDSSGCIVGHCAELYTYDELPKFKNGTIDFSKVSELIGIRCSDDMWNFLFGSGWGDRINVDLRVDAMDRMDYVIKNNATPSRWYFSKQQTFCKI
jgi:hypothetical protein